MISRTCTKCKEVKPSTNKFWKPNKGYKDGFHTWCRDCLRAWDRNNWKVNNIKRKDQHMKYRHTQKGRYACAKADIRHRGWKVELTYEEYTQLVSQSCYYCNYPLNPDGVGLDRLDNQRGYSIDNVVPCCRVCNQARSNFFTPEEMKRIGALFAIIRNERFQETG